MVKLAVTLIWDRFQWTESIRWVTLRSAVVSTARIWLGVLRLWTYLEPQGPSPTQSLTLLGEVKFITWHLKRPFLVECRRRPRNYWSCRAHLNYCPASRPTFKRPCATLVLLVGRRTNAVTLIHRVGLGYPSSPFFRIVDPKKSQV